MDPNLKLLTESIDELNAAKKLYKNKENINLIERLVDTAIETLRKFRSKV